MVVLSAISFQEGCPVHGRGSVMGGRSDNDGDGVSRIGVTTVCPHLNLTGPSVTLRKVAIPSTQRLLESTLQI